MGDVALEKYTFAEVPNMKEAKSASIFSPKSVDFSFEFGSERIILSEGNLDSPS